MRTYIFKRLLILTVLVLLQVCDLYAQFEEGGKDPTQIGVLPCSLPLPASNTVTVAPSQGESSKKIQNIIRFKVNELAATGTANGSPLLYFKSGFTATVSLTVDIWNTVPGSPGTPPDQTLTPATPLSVTYDPAAGIQYNPIAYWVLNGLNGYQQVRVNVSSITITGLSNGWAASDVLPLLTVENEMRVLRYFSSPSLPSPAITTAYDAANHPDQLSVSWPLPLGANSSQLEYAWVENETQGYYAVNGTFSTDKLFQINSTRVDIDSSGEIFNIPLLYDANPALGGGTLYYRVRSVQRKNDGNVNTGAWGTVQTFAYNGHEPGLNWQSSTSFAENGKTSTVIRYFDGSMRPRQIVTKDNSTGNTTVAETIYDLQGRPNVQILPTPTLATTIDYYRDFNRFSGQTANDNPAKYFDLSIAGTQCNGSPQLDTTRGNGQYYSHNNPWIGIENTANYIPDARGYAYTETRYMDDPTQRISSQGGVGQAHQIGNGHDTKYYYGKPNQNELDALFGTEAGDASHYFKNMVQDANGQMSVSYVDMHGRTIATALAGANPANLSNINNNSSFYPVAPGLLTDSLLSSATNIIQGDSISSISTILIPATTEYNFTYQLVPAILQQVNCNAQQICFDCKYNLEISIRQEDCSNAVPIVMDYNNLQVVPANQACGTPMGFIGNGIITPTTQISFSKTLTAGSWVIRKTLTINDSTFKVREDSALSAFLCKTQQNLSDSIFAVLSTASGCNSAIPTATQNCTACQALLGSDYASSNYKAAYIASVGGSTTLSDLAIHALYTQDSLDCADACGTSINPSFSTLAGIRRQMLNDMIPYTGQYALPLDSISSLSNLQAKYNIFTAGYTGTFGQFSNGTKPFYLNPVSEPNGAISFYTGDDGSVDNTIYPDGTGASLVNSNISVDSFANMFNRNWAEQLIYYHPEYSKLHFAETTLQSTYTWQDNVLQCNTYAQALARGYLDPIHHDPYFTYNNNQGYVPADEGTMANDLTVKINSSTAYTIWRIANGTALCDTTQPLLIRENCMQRMNSTNIDSSAVTAAQQDAVWQAFRTTYLGYRNEMVINYINSQQAASLSATAMTELQAEGKQLWFANGQTLANQNGEGNQSPLTFWARATDTTIKTNGAVDSVALMDSASAYIAVNSVDQCVGQRPFWQSRLLQCEQLQQYLAKQDNADSVTVNTIISAILDSMVMVCHNSINSSNPSGASNVNPAYLPTKPASFEDIVNHVFAQYGIATVPGNNYFCNPYSIDFPKPYNSNPQMFANNSSTVDTCNCKQFALLKASAASTGVDTTSLSSMNTYLLANYNDTLTLILWQGLQQCSSNNWFRDTCFATSTDTTHGCTYCRTAASSPSGTDTCFITYQRIHLSDAVEIPAFLSCNYAPPCVSCATLQTYTATFAQLYPGYSGVPYTTSSTDTAQAKQNALWARYLNYKTGFSKTANEYIAFMQNCNASSPQSDVTDLVLTDRTTQPPTGSTLPLLYTASNSITFDPGYTSISGDNFQTLISPNGIVGTGTVGFFCALDEPVTAIALPDTTHKNSCQTAQDQANFIGQILFRKVKDSLIANFDSLYRAKCLSAQSTEVFYATYAPAEYHYTLYYYDQAGNLVKTLAPAAVKPDFDPAYLAQVQSARAAANDLSNGTNIENMATQYRYNTLNQVTAQRTPDAGISHFWYDRLGRLAVSQNASQTIASAYSYTLYDPLGRITEVGQKPQTTAMTQAISQDTTGLSNWLADLVNGGAKQQITRTVYDIAYPGFTGTGPITQLNLRNRVAYTQVIDVDNTNPVSYRAATFYSYDPHGNVDTLLQDYGPNSVMGANASGNRFKLIKYDFDLVSGKVNQVSYQPGQADGYYHQYRYDALNRLTGVMTSKDSVLWQNDAAYFYYRHGPLARTQLGDLQVQGVDYAYTLHGWLKSINPSSVTASGDLYDSDGTSTLPLFERDAYKLNLNYYDDGTYTDYTPIAPPTGYVQGNALPSASKYNLYNGNIGSMAVNIREFATQATAGAAYAGPIIYNYRYDQLNRIAGMDAWQANGSFTPAGSSPMQDFAERYSYDPNGNILTLSRNGTTGNSGQLAMDNLSYQYLYVQTGGGTGEYVPGQAPTTGVDHLTNQLSSIRDAVGSGNYPNDIDNQSPHNYTYDAIGNLVGDVQEGITNITWSVYGKILSITKNGSTISYTYDASGNRISKTVAGITTWYVRDATGNVMSVYTQGDNTKNSGAITQAEIHLYGSSRLGILNSNVNCTNLVPSPQTVFIRGSKLFELSNHLGNVLVTVSDKKLQHSTDGTTIDYYNPDVITANDFYSFGMQMPGRTYSVANTNYRYGFNGKELDKETSSTTTYDYGFRIYSPALGRFLSTDPLTQKYPQLTPYQFASNNPVEGIDLDGLEYVSSKQIRIEVIRGIVKLKVENMTTVVKNMLTNYNNDPKNWAPNSIGADFSVGRINLQQIAPQAPSSAPDPSDANPNNRPGQTEVGKPIAQGTGLPDGRYKDRTVTTASPAGAKGLAVAQIAMEVLVTGANWYINGQIKDDESMINRHVGFFKAAAADVNYAMSKGMIPKGFQTQEYLSDIINVVLSGNSYINSTDQKAGAKILEIGQNIYNTLSVKRNEYTGRTIETGGLDGIPTIKVPERNVKYDAQYVKENPPLK